MFGLLFMILACFWTNLYVLQYFNIFLLWTDFVRDYIYYCCIVVSNNCYMLVFLFNPRLIHMPVNFKENIIKHLFYCIFYMMFHLWKIFNTKTKFYHVVDCVVRTLTTCTPAFTKPLNVEYAFTVILQPSLEYVFIKYA